MLAAAVRQVSKREPAPAAGDGSGAATASCAQPPRWVVLDGPVDPIWVEGLNTALDSSRVLFLPSGERIAIEQGMNIMFEVSRRVVNTASLVCVLDLCRSWATRACCTCARHPVWPF